MVSQQNPIRLFVSHAWQADDDYQRVFEYLESSRNFFYVNYSTPDKPPSGDKEAQKEDLRKQISPAEAVIILSSMHRRHSDLIEFQAHYAKACDKPVILLVSFGSTSAISKTLQGLADEVVNWDERGLVDAIKRQARHEETTRWDTIEFKLD
jgi:hypothetical protein